GHPLGGHGGVVRHVQRRRRPGGTLPPLRRHPLQRRQHGGAGGRPPHRPANLGKGAVLLHRHRAVAATFRSVATPNARGGGSCHRGGAGGSGSVTHTPESPCFARRTGRGGPTPPAPPTPPRCHPPGPRTTFMNKAGRLASLVMR